MSREMTIGKIIYKNNAEKQKDIFFNLFLGFMMCLKQHKKQEL
jgi:hypothetical protein